ncbi:MAG: LamG domain-containing protein, partial [Pirellulaceae bacterium]|nr:LamG domain-containing protein [Pirellulaceae bacterium]
MRIMPWVAGAALWLCFVSPAVAAVYSDALTSLPGLVSYWPLNEAPGSSIAADAIAGDGVDGYNTGVFSGRGIALGDAGPRPADGWLGFAADNLAPTFTGLPGAQLAMSNVAGYAGMTDATLLGWVRVTNPAVESLTNTFGGLQTTDFPRSAFAIDHAPTGLRGMVRRGSDDRVLVGPASVSNLSTWHFVALTYQGGAMGRLYWDGVEVASISLATVRGLDQATALVFGRDIGDPTRALHGQIDELAMFNRALAPSEIQTLFLAAKGEMPHVPGTVATAGYFETALNLGGLRNHWRFSETSGTRAIDVVGGNNGTFVNVAGAPVSLAQSGPTSSEGHDNYSFTGFEDDNSAVRFVWNTGANYMQIDNGQRIGSPTTGLSFADGVEQLTMSMWFKKTYDSDGYLAGFSKPGTSNRYVFSVYSPNGTDLRFYAMSDNGVQMTSPDITVDSPGDCQWHHVVQVWDGTEKRLRVYVDGQERFNDANASMTRNLFIPGGFHLGRDVYASIRNLGGLLDEVSMF